MSREIRSKDGTVIAFDQTGQGPTLILVGGATITRQDQAGLAADLAPFFTAITYDRRGRGDSGDTAPYAIEREVEDIEALIDAAGGSALVFGHSSGAALALEAARLLPHKITKLALYEPPFIIDDSRSPVADNYVEHLQELIAVGRRGDALAYFMVDAVQMPAEMVAGMRQAPMWPGLEAIAHTLVYDGLVMGATMRGNPASLQKWAGVPVPTLVMAGGISPAFMHSGTRALAELLPHAQHRTLPGQDHGPANDILIPALREFLLD